MMHIRIVVFLLLATPLHFTPAMADLTAEDMLRIQKQIDQASQQGQLLQDSQIVRPSPRERAAISQMLATLPRPKTLNDADIKYLRDLLDKATWFGIERRIMHEMWTEVSGKEWQDTEVPQPPKHDASP